MKNKLQKIDHLLAVYLKNTIEDDGELVDIPEINEARNLILELIESIDLEKTRKEKNQYHQKILLDCEIQDWRVAEGAELPDAHKENYRFVIEQSVTVNQVYFKLYPTSLDQLSRNTTQNGLAGVVEIRNGKPAISLGVFEEDQSVHIESDAHKGLFVHHDFNSTPEYTSWRSESHNMEFKGYYYPCDNRIWLRKARKELAEIAFDNYQFDQAVTAMDDWSVSDDIWSRTVHYKDHNGEKIKGNLQIKFAVDAVLILSIIAN